MSFDFMRKHQQKIWVPLAVLVTIGMVFFGSFTAGMRSCAVQGFRGQRKTDMAITGQQLAYAGMAGPINRDRVREEVEKQLGAGSANEDERHRQEIALVENYYARVAANLHYLPLQLAGEVGLAISDEEVDAEARRIVTDVWQLKPYSREAMLEELESRNLSEWRFRELVRVGKLRERLLAAVSAAAGASEADQYAEYARERQKVRVQYFQRDAKDFLAAVKILPGDRPAATPAEKSDEKPAENPGEAPAEPEKKGGAEAPAAGAEQPAQPAGAAAGGEEKKEEGAAGTEAASAEKPPEPEPGTLYEGDIRKNHGEMIEQLREQAGGKPGDKDFVWPEWLCSQFPDLFRTPRLRGRYLLADCKDFEPKVKVADEEITKKYGDNKEAKYKVQPPPGTPPPEKPEYKPLDAKLRDEIRKELLADKAADAARVAIDAAVAEHNAMKPEEMTEEKLGELAGKHGLRLESFGPLSQEDVEAHDHLGALMVRDVVAGLFGKSAREELGAKLAKVGRLNDGVGYVSVRVLEHNDVVQLEYSEAEAGFTYRQKCDEAWKLAQKAIEDDLKALREGKLDPALVRQSELLGPEDETCRAVVRAGLAPGEAVKEPYRYSQLLGPAKEAEDKRLKEKEEAEKDLPSGRRKPEEKSLEDRIYDSAYRELRGWRAIILAERELPTLEQFRADAPWRGQWGAKGMNEDQIRMYRMFNMPYSQPGGVQWREDLLGECYSGWIDAMEKELTE